MATVAFSPPPTAPILARVGRETVPSLVPSSEVDALRTTRTESGFLNVYASRHVWVAKVKEGGRLTAIPGSRQPTPQQAAAFVVAWYRARFGEAWQMALANRKRPYWQVRYSAKWNGYYIRVWANGHAVEYRERAPNGRLMDRPLIFGLRSEAVEYAKRDIPRQRREWAAWAPPRA